MKKNFLALVAVVTLLLWGRSIQAEANIIEKKITLGVLARNGRSKAIKQWAATAEYLTAYIDRTVTVAPLAFKDILPAVESKKVDFIIINPSLFVTARVKYSAWPVVTMKTAGNDKFGAVVFTAASNKKINTLKDLRAKKFGAVQRSSLGGWQMAHKEFADAGIDIYNFFSTLRFFETHSGVVNAVLNHQVHAGTVRTGTLEEMIENGEVKLDDFKIINEKEHPGFPFVVSTPLYPEWVLAGTASTDRELAKEVAAALKYLTEGAKAAVDAQCTGWGDPWDYTDVEELQKQLKVGAYKEEKE